MLKKAFIFSFIGIFICLVLFVLNLCIITKKDAQNFSKNEQKGNDIKSHSAYQKRKDVKKDLYIIDNDIRKHYIIKSQNSEIFLNKKNQNYEIIENLDNITLICFENIDNISKLKQVKYITAKNGLYYFPSHNLELNDVDVSFFNTSKINKLNLNKAYFSGHAKELNFSVEEKKPIIEISSFEGSFDPKKGIKCEK